MKVQNPLIGRVKGSAGGMTGCKMYDKNVLKAKAFEVNNPNTPAQQTQRAFFKEVESYANLLSDEELKFLFPQKPKGMSRRSMLAKQLAEFTSTSGSVKSIDFANLVTLGNAPTAKLPNIEITWDEEGEFMYANWDTNSAYVQEHGTDKLVILAINKSKNKIILDYQSNNFGEGAQEFPNSFSNDADDECYGMLFNVGNPTEIVTFGTLNIVERPARKKSTQN